MNPQVSVVIDTYNQEQFIAQAIQSVLNQDFPKADMEILVVDDGSTDRTPEIVRKFEPAVRLLQKANGGQASAINLGTAEAKGDLVAFLDGDDLWLPNKLSRITAEFDKNPRLSMAYHKYAFWNERENQTWEPVFHEISGDVLADRRKLVTYIAAPTSSLIFRRESIMRLMPVPVQCSFMHDAFLVSTVTALGPVMAIPERLAINRVHGSNLWFGGTGRPEPAVLDRRIRVRHEAVRYIREWTRRNCEAGVRKRVNVLANRWELLCEIDAFQVASPGRLRHFAHFCREDATWGFTLTKRHRTYRWTKELFALIAGRERARYLEGVRTRMKKVLARFERGGRTAAHGSRPA